MTSERVTKCPHCNATFKVSDEQLAIANGRVRCGACMNIFDALAYTISNEASSSEPSATNEQPTNDELKQETFLTEQGTAVSNNQPDDLNDLDADGLIADNPDEDKKESGYSESMLSDEFSSSFLGLDGQEQDPYATDLQKVETHTDDSAEDESWAESILEDDPEPAIASTNLSSGNSPQSPNLETTPEPSIQSEPPLRADTREELDESDFLTTSDEVSPSETPEKNFESLRFEYKQDKPAKRWIMSFLLVVFNSTLLIVLLAQIAWFNYEKLAKYPQAALAFEKACELLDCTIPELADLSLIKSQNLVVRSHPTRASALIIDTVIVNEADFDQDFPDISLYFSDINGQVVAQRLISPQEYLSTDLLSWKKIPSQEQIHITLEIIDPGKEAVNYKLKFFPPSKPMTDQYSDQMSTNQNKI